MTRFHLFALAFAFGLCFFSAVASDSVILEKDSGGEVCNEKVGLVLSGGGAKGIAHIGVIKALEDNDIPIDYVTGTSAGAIVGSLYACGWSPAKILSLFLSPQFRYWSSGDIDPEYVAYFSKPEPVPDWVSVNIGFKDTTVSVIDQVIPQSLINPIPMNIEFLRLYLPYTRQCESDFDKLFVPFRCVTSDVYHKHKIVCADGSLGDAVRESMSFPLVFRPIERNGILVYDGGIYDNFPVDVMEDEFNPDFIVGVSVSGPDQPPVEGSGIYTQLEDMIIQNNDYSVPEEKGIKIQVPVLGFGVLDWAKGQEIYDIGYKTGLEMVDSIKGRVRARRDQTIVEKKRAAFAASTPDPKFDTVVVSGADPSASAFLQKLFTRGRDNEPFGLDQVQNAYYQAVTTGKLSNLMPQSEIGDNGNDRLLLKAYPKKKWKLGIGGWITSSANSQIFLTAGFHTLSFNSLNMDVSAWLGQSYMAGAASARMMVNSGNPSWLKLEYVVSRQKYYDSELLFYQTSTPSFITELQTFARVTYAWQMGMKARGYVSFGGGYLADKYFPTNAGDFAGMSRDKCSYRAMAFKFGIDGGSLDDLMYPSSGEEWRADVLLTYENSRYQPGDHALQSVNSGGYPTGSVEVLWRRYFQLHKKMSVGVFGNALGTLARLNNNYTSTLVHAPEFAPTPSTRNYFNPAFRSNNYLAAGVMPVWKPLGNFQLRGDFYLYAPIRNLKDCGIDKARYDGWFRRCDFIGEVAAVYNFSFASISLYANYLTYPARNWNFGINLGLMFQAPRLLR